MAGSNTYIADMACRDDVEVALWKCAFRAKKPR